MALTYKQVELPLVGPIALKVCEKLDPINTGSKPKKTPSASKSTKTPQKKKAKKD